MRVNLLTAASVVLTLSCATATAREVTTEPRVDRKAGVPTVLSFEVRPSYFNYVLKPVSLEEEEEKSLRIHLTGPTDIDWSESHWRPTVALCLTPADQSARQSYCTNVTLNDADVAFGSARLISDQGEEMFRKVTPRFDAHAPMLLEVARKGTHVTITINGELVDEGDLGFVPAFWKIGASTGTAHVELLDMPVDEVLLDATAWPRTLEAAVDEAIGHLSIHDKQTFRDLEREEIATFWIGWGTMLRDRQGLGRGNDALRVAVCGTDCTPDDAAKAIMDEVWMTLKGHPER